MAETCSNCRFWDAYTAGDGWYDDVTPGMIGDCRRRPPIISEELLRRKLPGPSCDQFDSLANDAYVASAFPVTHSSSWCGEHQLRQDGAAPHRDVEAEVVPLRGAA